MQLISLGPRLLRVPSFGDYAVNYPEETFVDPRIMRMSANLRYTLDSEWLILRGRNTRQFGFEQFRDLCSSLVMKSEFAGPSFSAGDKFIDDCAQGSTGPGNATVWRRVGTSHHLTHVSNQIANLP